MASDEIGTTPGQHYDPGSSKPKRLLALARAPLGSFSWWAKRIDRAVVLGRAAGAEARVYDTDVSRNHCRFTPGRFRVLLEDLGSSNGTFVNGERIAGPVKLRDQDLIRVGAMLFVFHADARALHGHGDNERHGIVGPVHGPVLMDQLREAAGSGRNLLIAGPSGSGKELCARAVATMLERSMLIQNAARFATEDEAKSSLFGVGDKVFTGVEERPGYIELAQGKVLFLDEAHVLPRAVLKSLLRVIEDGRSARIGESRERAVDVRFVLASNEPGRSHGLPRDLRARLRVVEVPGLGDRRSDVPEIFDHLLERELKRVGLEEQKLDQLVSVHHYQALILDGFEDDNVRGLHDIAERIATRASGGTAPRQAVTEVFFERYGFRASPEPAQPGDPASPSNAAGAVGAAGFERCPDVGDRLTGEVALPDSVEADERALVEAAYWRVGSSANAIRDDLRDRGASISWRRVVKLMDELGLPRSKRGG